MGVEQTLSIVKPDAVRKNVIGKILDRLEMSNAHKTDSHNSYIDHNYLLVRAFNCRLLQLDYLRTRTNLP